MLVPLYLILFENFETTLAKNFVKKIVKNLIFIFYIFVVQCKERRIVLAFIWYIFNNGPHMHNI